MYVDPILEVWKLCVRENRNGTNMYHGVSSVWMKCGGVYANMYLQWSRNTVLRCTGAFLVFLIWLWAKYKVHQLSEFLIIIHFVWVVTVKVVTRSFKSFSSSSTVTRQVWQCTAAWQCSKLHFWGEGMGFGSHCGVNPGLLWFLWICSMQGRHYEMLADSLRTGISCFSHSYNALNWACSLSSDHIVSS